MQTEMSKAGPMGLLKALLLASQGVEPVEANADFIAEVDAVAGDAARGRCPADHWRCMASPEVVIIMTTAGLSGGADPDCSCAARSSMLTVRLASPQRAEG